ncbi:right-handed parallel beta-helix repeat-containing protein [uncultured Formosa sp.]|uniref:right-handed parallel beta-helix repeat-containing protein n=1 Tax=uncultured Formosa sp. TaxID=255435 RepID=UPI0026312943|nr:right-handed parallel beta-helix repeat-containing protein [uncultured Formosa sp.]
MNIKILICMLCFSGCFISQGYAQKEAYLKYPHTEISNKDMTLTFFLPDRKKGFYRTTHFDWSGLVASLKYKGKEFLKGNQTRQKTNKFTNILGPTEALIEGGLGYDEAVSGGKFIRLGVGILQKGKESVYDSKHSAYKILDHGTWKIDQGKDWISFTHTLSSDFGYAYIYKKTIRLSNQGFIIEHHLQNTGINVINIDLYNANTFGTDDKIAELPFKIIYPFKLKTENSLSEYVKIEGNEIQFTNTLTDLVVSLDLKGFEFITPNNKLTIENSELNTGITISSNQPLNRELLFANNKSISTSNIIDVSVPVNDEKTWTTNYFFYDTQAVQKKVNYEITKVEIEPEVYSIMQDKWNDEFKHVTYPEQFLEHVVDVNPGESIQSAMDAVSNAGGGVVVLKKGIHYLEDTLIPRSKVTLVGERQAETIIMQGPDMLVSGINVEPEQQVTDFIIKDLILQGTRKGKANGIRMSGKNGSRHTRIMFQNITVRDWSAQGVHLKRTDNIIMDHCDFQYNGSAGGLYHNVYFLYNKYILQSDCDMSNPIKGKGNKYTSCEFVLAQRCKIRDANGNGIQADHEEAGYIFLHKFDISGCGRVALWFPCENYYDKYNYTENPKYAPQNIILNRCNVVDNTWGAMWRSVKNSYVINCMFKNKKVDMGLLNCDVIMEQSEFIKGNETYKSVDKWPGDVKLLW